MPCRRFALAIASWVLAACTTKARPAPPAPASSDAEPPFRELLLSDVDAGDAGEASLAEAVPFEPVQHCKDLQRIARQMGLLPSPARSDDDLRRGGFVPSGFARCHVDASTVPSLNMHRFYECRVNASDEAFARLAETWKSCLAPPAWKRAKDVTYGAVRSAMAYDPNAYVSTSYRRDTTLFSEGYCVLDRPDPRTIRMACGDRRNN